MKTVCLLHNPRAGARKYTRKKLIRLIKSKGYRCIYHSIKKDGWHKIDDGVDFLVIAGGDGTVRRVITKLFEKDKVRKYPIAILPLGTANNIASSLHITGKPKQIIDSWKDPGIIKFDLGLISGLSENHIFLEGIGFGVFPNLMNEMEKDPSAEEAKPEEKLHKALTKFEQIVDSYNVRDCALNIDGVDYSGKFLMVEIMNTHAIGPNLELNPTAETDDGEFEVVLVTARTREKLQDYVADKKENEDEYFDFRALKAKSIALKWKGIHIHVDDKVIKEDAPVKVKTTIRKRMVTMFGPKTESKRA